jgi:hypothetical protein
MSNIMKYRLTKAYIVMGQRTLYQIQAVKDFGDIKAGDLGGWIEKEENLSQEGDCWVYGAARVFGHGRVYEDANILGRAWVMGCAAVYGKAMVYGHAQVCGSAQVFGDAQITTTIDSGLHFGNSELGLALFG